MPRRTQIYQKIPWTGGTNTSVDSGLIPQNDLVQSDNTLYAASGVRTKREGFDFFDTSLPAVVSRSSSGTTRTLVFASAITGGSPNNSIIVVGEKLSISGTSNTNYNSEAAIVASVSGSTITYTFAGAASLSESSTASTATTVVRNYDIIGVLDFWYFHTSNEVKTQLRIAVTSQGLIFKYDANGRRTQIVMSGSGANALVTSPTIVDVRAFNNVVVFFFNGVDNTPKYFNPNDVDEWKDIPGAPDGSICMEHQGRLWCNDKLNPDYLHYCTTFDYTEWQGVGDSGAIYVSPNDGDNQGLTCIKPPFKGRLLVSKGMREFQVIGQAPEEYVVQPITSGVGAVAHRAAVPYDFTDMFYVSRKGFHSVNATDQFGDFTGTYISKRIQPTFNEWATNKLNLIQGAYFSKLNSAAWIVAEDGQTKPNALWLYNPTIPNEDGSQGVWYRWPSLNAQSICSTLDSSGNERPLIGNNQGRLLIGQNGTFIDPNSTGINFRIKSGTVYPDANPQTIKGFKKFGLLFKPKGRFNFTVYFKVDNFPIQALVYNQDTDGDLLGSEFTLGSSILGSFKPLAPYMRDVYGHGRGCTIEVFQTGAEAQVEIYGYLIEYELEDVADEVAN